MTLRNLDRWARRMRADLAALKDRRARDGRPTAAEFRAAYRVARKHALATLKARKAGEPPPVADRDVIAAQEVLRAVPGALRETVMGAKDRLLRGLDNITKGRREDDSA